MLTIRKNFERVGSAAVAGLNALRRDTTIVGARFHSGVIHQATNQNDPNVPTVAARTVSTTASTDLPTVIVLVNGLFGVLTAHFAESVSVHLAADPTAVAALAAGVTAVDLATTITLVNLCKSVFNTHCAQAGVHFNNDATNTIATANATDLASSITLANASATKVNAHMASAPAGYAILLSNA